MEGSSSAGLRNAPITKLLLGSVLLNSTLLSVLEISDLFSIHLVPQIWGETQLWRLGLWQLACASFSEVLFSSLALYNLSDVERFMGSSCYAAFVALAYGTTSLLVPSVLGFLVRPFSAKANFLACGMTPTIFAIMFQYHALIPPTTFLGSKSTVLSHSHEQQKGNENEILRNIEAVCTDKLWIYAIAAQIALYRSPSSLVGAAVGWTVGAIYHYSIMPRNWRLPAILTWGVHSRAVGTIVQESPSTPEFRTRSPTVRSTEINGSRQPVSDTDVETLINMMNVPRDVAIEALHSSGGSVESAVDRLLMQ